MQSKEGMVRRIKNIIEQKSLHYLGLVQELYYSWINALANKLILLQNPERVSHPGELYPDKTFYVISDLPYCAGIGSWYDRIIGYILRARAKGWIPVVYPQYSEPLHSGDWYDFFQEISPYTVEEVLRAANVVYAVQQGMIHKRFNKKEIARRNQISQEIKLSKYAEDYIEKNN
jgi:hypothetical protein